MTDGLAVADAAPRAMYFYLDESGRTPRQLDGYFDWLDERMFEGHTTKVARTKLQAHLISTVFCSVVAHRDHLFETKIFEMDANGRVNYDYELAAWYCPTWDGAESNHQQAIAWLEEQLETAKTWNMLR